MSDHHWSYTSAHPTAENGSVLVQKRCTLCDLAVEYWTGIEPVHPSCTYKEAQTVGSEGCDCNRACFCGRKSSSYVEAEKLALASISVLRDRLRKSLEDTTDAERSRKDAIADFGFDPFVVPLAGATLAMLVGDSVLEEAKAMLRRQS